MANGTGQVAGTNSDRGIGHRQGGAVHGHLAIGKKEEMGGIGKKVIGDKQAYKKVIRNMDNLFY